MALRCGFGLITLFALTTPAIACLSPYNLIVNCGFTAGTTSWENQTSGSCVPNSSSGVTDAANITCTSFAGGLGHVVRFRQCIKTNTGVAANKLYAYGVYGQLVSGSNVSCNVQAADFTQDNCQFNINAVTTPLSPAGSYVKSTEATYLTGAGTQSAHLQVECTSPTSFQIRVDDAFFSDERIFADGFQ